MATTTPNFGWTVPTSSDLVKNGATAIETLGDSVDASFAGLTVNAQTGTTYTAVKADGLNAIVTMDNASANTFNIPTDASVNFDIGTVLNIYMKGAGVTTITATTPGTTTVVSAGATIGSPVLARYKIASAIKLAANSWTVIGGIS